jgi:alkylhydroperoxidase/carboxymuconolactone decarboxylase family protein
LPPGRLIFAAVLVLEAKNACFALSVTNIFHPLYTKIAMAKEKEHYFSRDELKQFGNITEFQETMGKKYFDWYGEVMQEGALTAREKALIALAVAHAIQCPYCIDAYSSECLKQGSDEEQMMEAVHVAATIRAGTSLVYSVQMMNHVKKLTM